MSPMSTATTSTMTKFVAGHNTSSCSSQFSDNALSTLESLVLACALEDASTLANGSYEMKAEDYLMLMQLPGNNACADCGGRDTEWASVTYGILLCAHCSGQHRQLGTHLSRVRSIKMDSWSEEHLARMKFGGNAACNQFLLQQQQQDHDEAVEGAESHNTNNSIRDKYSGTAAQIYKQELDRRIETGELPVIIVDEKEKPVKSPFKQSAKQRQRLVQEEEEEKKEDDSIYSTSGVNKASSNHSGNDDQTSTPLKQSSSSNNKDNNNKPQTPIQRASTMNEQRSKFFGLSLNLTKLPRHHSQNDLTLPSLAPTTTITASAPTITYMGRSFSAADPHGDTNQPKRRGSWWHDYSIEMDMEQDDSLQLIPTNDNTSRRSSAPTFFNFQSWSNTKDKEKHTNAASPLSDTSCNSNGSGGNDNKDAHYLLPYSIVMAEQGHDPDASILPFLTATDTPTPTRQSPSRHSSSRTGSSTTPRRLHRTGSLPTEWTATTSCDVSSSFSEELDQLAYNHHDILQIARDDYEFGRLQLALKAQGAITNALARQRLYAFVANHKRRHTKHKVRPAQLELELSQTLSSDNTVETMRCSNLASKRDSYVVEC